MSQKPVHADTQKLRNDAVKSPRKRWKRRVIEAGIGLVLAPIVVWACVKSLSGNLGLTRILDDEVAVHVDYGRGTETTVTMPGYRAYLPWLQEVYRLDKSPNAFLMKGNVSDGANHVPRLLVRANDGSSFWFDDLTLQYALIPDRADVVLRDAGPADAFKGHLLHGHARAILRDEFGRYSAEDVARPENLREATQRALVRLNAALNPHGIEVLEISTAKPSFDKNYEEQIARRKLANQEVERLRAEMGQIERQKEQRLQAVRYDKERELKQLRSNLAYDLGVARKEVIRATAEADVSYQEMVTTARLTKLERETAAASESSRNRALFDDAKKHAAALEARGEAAVRSALVSKLAGIEFSLVPYSRDPAPQRIEQETTTAWSGKK